MDLSNHLEMGPNKSKTPRKPSEQPAKKTCFNKTKGRDTCHSSPSLAILRHFTLHEFLHDTFPHCETTVALLLQSQGQTIAVEVTVPGEAPMKICFCSSPTICDTFCGFLWFLLCLLLFLDFESPLQTVCEAAQVPEAHGICSYDSYYVLVSKVFKKSMYVCTAIIM